MTTEYVFFFSYFRPPRFMGDGFVVLQSNDVDIYYYHDEPGMIALFRVHKTCCNVKWQDIICIT